MSQQELVPEPQDHEQQAAYDQAVGEPAYYARPLKRGGPKEEHPATFEESIPPYSYPAQDRVGYTGAQERQTRQQTQQQGSRTTNFEPDGDALEAGYRPYQRFSQWQIPPWARPQRHKRSNAMRWLVAAVLILLMIKLLPLLLLGILGITVFLVLLPFLILFGLLVIALVVVILALMGVPVWRMRWRARVNRRRWGRPWM